MVELLVGGTAASGSCGLFSMGGLGGPVLAVAGEGASTCVVRVTGYI